MNKITLYFSLQDIKNLLDNAREISADDSNLLDVRFTEITA